jgi:hypothetical protein
MSTNKRITINPLLFKPGGQSKTKKARTPTETPIISPNILKNKLIGRIKEHKNKEATNLATTVKPMLVDQSLVDFNNEFNNSLDYLQSISKQKKVEEEKDDYERKKQELYRKTVKNSNHPFVNVELHEDLKEHPKPQVFESMPRPVNYTIKNNEPVSTHQNHTLKLRPNSSVPYGNLKGGTKPTYREWAKPVDNEREKRLNALKEKIKQQKEQQRQKLTHLPIENAVAPNLPTKIDTIFPTDTNLATKIDTNLATDTKLTTKIDTTPTTTVDPNAIETRLTKRTIRKQHTIGKSTLKNTVSVLLKNNVTRKNVIMAHKELKQKPINEVKLYLREHNLIKAGSNAPNYMLREIYESSMLAGQIQNNNKDTMLHNFLTEQQ